jgi:hypothetical protein
MLAGLVIQHSTAELSLVGGQMCWHYQRWRSGWSLERMIKSIS